MNFGRNTIVSVLSAGLLCGVFVDMKRLIAPDDATHYHQMVREAAGRIPKRFGDWISEDGKLPRAAVKLLRPNVVLCRSYTNLVTNRRAMFLLVQVADARDLQGHYPPVCYKVQGYTSVMAQPKDWVIPNHAPFTGMEYQFNFESFDRSESKYIANFMVMPDGTVQRDINAVYTQAADLRKRFFGAGQVQVIMDSNYPPQERDEIVRALVDGNRDLIDAIRSGVIR